MKPILKIQKLDENVTLPKYQKEGDSGMDLHVILDEPYLLHSLERKLFDTKLRFEIPEGYEVQLRPRSGLAVKNGITLINCIGTIDFLYRNSIKVGLVNLSNKAYVVNNGDRIAQAVLSPIVQAEIVEVDEISINTERGEGGFGSTGR